MYLIQALILAALLGLLVSFLWGLFDKEYNKPAGLLVAVVFFLAEVGG